MSTAADQEPGLSTEPGEVAAPVAATAPPPPTVRRRGRGVFNRPLHAEQPISNPVEGSFGGSQGGNVAGATSVTTAVAPTVLPISVGCSAQAPEEDLAAQYGGQKRDIPFNVRENFGVHQDEHTVGTVRQLLFCGEKRRRYCIIVGDLQNPNRHITLKLFGHKGLKPFKLQNKLIRLVNISVGRARPVRPADATTGGANGDGEDDDNSAQQQGARDASHDEGEGELSGDLDGNQQQVQQHVELGAGDADEERKPLDKKPENAELNTANQQFLKREERDDEGEQFLNGIGGTSSTQNHNNDSYSNEDVILPLTVEMRDSTTTNIGQTSSVANSPVLTAKRFDTLHGYFFREFHHLLQLEDVRMHNVSISLSLGAVYCCLAREGSYSTPLKYATFSEFVQRMNEESMQLYFLKDAPTCVSRAVDRECGALQSEASFSLVRICFFSNERQSRTVVRAIWNAHENRFALLDMESIGVTFTWTVFSVDETDIQMTKKNKGSDTTVSGGETSNERDSGSFSNNVDNNTTEEAQPMRKKTVAFPFEIELRAHRRWKQHAEHPVAPIAEAILDKLSLAEHNLIQYGSTIGYENMDLSKVCEADAESEDFNVESIIVEHTSRVKPRGTDLIVDSTSSLWIENFAAARAFHTRMAQGLAGENERQRMIFRRAGRGGNKVPQLPKVVPESPASRLTFFRSRGSTVHWKLRPGCSTEENLFPLSDALHFVQQVLRTANEIERCSSRGGVAPAPL